MEETGTIEVTVKTLDSQSRSYKVREQVGQSDYLSTWPFLKN